MTKHDLLEYLTDSGDVDAVEIANAFGIPYAAAAMAVLRLVRQGLAARGGSSGLDQASTTVE